MIGFERQSCLFVSFVPATCPWTCRARGHTRRGTAVSSRADGRSGLSWARTCRSVRRSDQPPVRKAKGQRSGQKGGGGAHTQA